MAQPRLRVYYGPEDDQSLAQVCEPETVKVPLREIVGALTDAALSQRSWLTDFADDEVEIPSDLHQVILAYQHFRRPSA